jgi:predicted acylesterase/phospholipase RssA
MADTADNIPTFIVATKALHADGPPTLFRSYQCQGHNASKCAIWEAGRATSAAPIFFKPIKIEIPRPGATFVDGGVTHNNPAELALSEAKKIWTTAKKVRLVSLGTGRLKSVQIVQIESGPPTEKSKWSGVMTKVSRLPSGSAALLSIGEACVKLTTNTEPVHQRLLKRSASTDPDEQFPYHRFNVDRDMQDIGLEEWRKVEEIAAHTSAYMEEAEGEINRNKCVHDLMNERTRTIS